MAPPVIWAECLGHRASTQHYDIIGDIHGHADALERLFTKLGYVERNAVYSHPSRKVIFLGDFIDRGPKILRVLEIARRMVDAGSALSILGNHELNALAYQTRDDFDLNLFMRRRDAKNFNQHKETLNQLTAAELSSYLDWFRTLPIWIDLGGLRVVHACWDRSAMSEIRNHLGTGNMISDAFLQQAFRKGTALYDAVEIVTKGKEAKLPDGAFFEDKDGHRRDSIRVKWYEPPDGHSYATYALQSDKILCERPIATDVIDAARPYSNTEPPVFIGHYWLSSVHPKLLASNVACLDFSVAKGGFLCSYRWDGERILHEGKFLW